MSYAWPVKTLTEVDETFNCLAGLLGKRWYCRGQPKHYEHLLPSIDRCGREKLSRIERLKLERESIDVYRATARFFSNPVEANALKDDSDALVVLRQHGVPTRLLDWSRSPYVATYFAVCDSDTEDGEILSFDERQYMSKGKEQWKEWLATPDDDLDWKRCMHYTEFTREEPPDWIICLMYPPGFHRQDAQGSLYTVTARFGRDHAQRMAELLRDPSLHCRYVISKSLKPKLRNLLKEHHGIWRGSLFPDAAGAAETARSVFKRV